MTNRLDALTRVQLALAQMADALASGEADAVLAAEAPLADAAHQLAALARTPTFTDGLTPAALRRAVLETRAGLGRCERLGGSMAAVAATVFPQIVYGPGPRMGRATAPVARS
jgi:hypothetical protein